MMQINTVDNSPFLYRYQNIKFYFKTYKNGGIEEEDYEQLKSILLRVDFWKVSLFNVSERRYRSIVENAMLLLADLFDDGAITSNEFKAELRKIRSDKPKSLSDF